MNDNLNAERNKRLLMRLANLNQKYKSNTVTSDDFTETGTTYSMNVVANNILGTNISSRMKVVDYKIDMDGRLVIIGEGGDVVTEFNIGSGFNGIIKIIIKTTDNCYLLGGRFSNYSNITANRIIKLNVDGSVNNTFDSNSGFSGQEVNSIIETSDGGYLIGGYFTSYSGITANSIIKLTSGGTVDDSFVSSGVFDSAVNYTVETSDGGYLLGGRFSNYSGIILNGIIKLTSGGTVDDSFVSGSGFDGSISSIIETSDGGYLIGGGFTSYSGITANGIIKLTSGGTVDDSFVSGSGFDGKVFELIKTSDSGYLIGGNFTSYSGITANRIIKLTSGGTIDNSFVSGSGFDEEVYSIIETSDGGYLIGGYFTSYSGITSNYIIKLTSGGTVDDSFVSGSGFDADINSIIETTDGGYLVGGWFNAYQGQTVNYIVKLKPDGTSITISE